MRLLLSVILVLVPSLAWAARYAIIGSDNVVVTVIESSTPPDPATLPIGGYFVAVEQGSGAESGGTYINGVFSPRPKSNSDLIGERLDAAIDANKTYLAISSPTNAQAIAQVKALTQQANGIMRLMRQKLDAVE